MARAVVALGANLGDPQEAVLGAIEVLRTRPEVVVCAASSMYVTAPIGGVEQPDYLNAVVLVETSASPRELLDILQGIENDWHRTREVRWGPRTLDLDLIDFEGVTSDDPSLTLPHPRAHERGFVLVPWLEIEAEAELTGFGPVEALVLGLSDQSVTIVPNR